MKYGFLRDVEYAFFDELLLGIKQEFGEVRFLEIGVFGGPTVTGVVNRCRELDCPVYAAGVDINPGNFVFPLPDYAYYQGDSLDMWRQVTGAFNCLFLDGCHCCVHAMSDFLNFSPFLVVGGLALFHDTAIRDGADKQDEHPQDHSYAGKLDSVLGVREGLKKLGLLQGYRRDWEFVSELGSPDGTCGFMLFRKILPL